MAQSHSLRFAKRGRSSFTVGFTALLPRLTISCYLAVESLTPSADSSTAEFTGRTETPAGISKLRGSCPRPGHLEFKVCALRFTRFLELFRPEQAFERVSGRETVPCDYVGAVASGSAAGSVELSGQFSCPDEESRMGTFRAAYQGQDAVP